LTQEGYSSEYEGTRVVECEGLRGSSFRKKEKRRKAKDFRERGSGEFENE
jgi:hypothetical protein